MRVLRLIVSGCFIAIFLSINAHAQSVVLWNKLGSNAEVESSEIGPNGSIHSGPIAYYPGQFGSGFQSRDGAGKSGVYFGSWENINPYYDEAGTVEFWWRAPRDYDEPHSTPDEVFVSATWDSPFPVPFSLLYRWREHSAIGGFEFRIHLETEGDFVMRTGKVAPFEGDQWVHVAFVWDINGLPGHPEVWYGSYIDGQYYPLIDVRNPGGDINVIMKKEIGDYFSMGYYDADYNNQQNGVMDNVIIWDAALADFSHRFTEDPNENEYMFETFVIDHAMLKFSSDAMALSDEVIIRCSFVLGTDSDGIYPFADDFVLTIGSYLLAIPAGSFVVTPKGDYRYLSDGSDVGDPKVFVLLREDTSETYKISIMIRNLELMAITNPIPLGLVIGNDQGNIEQRMAGVLYKVP
jgi:hypothetical protein